MDGGQLLKMITNDKLFKKAVANTIENLAKELEQAKLLINHNPEWSTPAKISEAIKWGSGGIGVYKIYHKDWIAEDVALYIGQGNISFKIVYLFSVVTSKFFFATSSSEPNIVFLNFAN